VSDDWRQPPCALALLFAVGTAVHITWYEVAKVERIAAAARGHEAQLAADEAELSAAAQRLDLRNGPSSAR
jgi:hypothetical protein